MESDAPLGQWIAASVLWEKDHREEARAAFLRAGKLAEQGPVRTLGALGPVAACVVDCYGERPAAGVACLTQHCPTGQSEWAGLDEMQHWCVIEAARCRYQANDLPGAERLALDAQANPKFERESDDGVLVTTTLMRVAAARGESAKAIHTLRAELAKMESKHHRRMAFEAALALGEVELRAGLPEGRKRLLKLEQEAKSREFARIARLAHEALDKKPVASAAPPR